MVVKRAASRIAASAHSAPISMNTAIFTPRTLTPARIAAFWLEPTALQWLPKRVSASKNHAIAVTISAIQTGTPTPRILARPIASVNCSGTVGGVTPFVSNCANPKATPSIPKVTMNEGTRSRVVRRPFTAPTLTPTANVAKMPMRIALHTPKAATDSLVIIRMPTEPESKRLEAIERSSSPVMMTNVEPTARMRIPAALEAIDVRLKGLKKEPFGTTIANTAKITISTPRIAALVERVNLFSRRIARLPALGPRLLGATLLTTLPSPQDLRQ